MMLKKEREVIFLLEKHLDEIKEWLKLSAEALSSYLSDDLEKIKYVLLMKNEIQTLLEAARQEIWNKLCNGAYFPAIRGDLLGIVKSVGGIADAATTSCERFSLLQPEMPIKIKNKFSTMVPIAFHLFGPVHESILYYLRGDDVLKIIRKNVDEFLRKMAELNVVESDLKELNVVESDLKHQIYSSALDNWQKSNLNDCMESISIVSSQVNETKDQIQQIMVKIAV
jgi:uncharacterized protein Yka (UPF0111/DUF47 family)